jgi:hypothetical protein
MIAKTAYNPFDEGWYVIDRKNNKNRIEPI